jgi:hypothetical protein
MGSDRARASFDPSRKWRALVAQQGRVTVEADWNEAAAIQALTDRMTALDIIGPLGSPGGGYAVTAGGSASPPSGGPGPLTVGTGTIYVGGVRLDLDQAVVLDGIPQPDWLDQSTDTLWLAPEAGSASPPASPPASTNELVYLLAVEQEVSALEVPELTDVALGGPDTMQRLRILQRFVRWPTGSADCSQAWAEVQAAWKTVGLDFDASTMMLDSSARLEVSFDPVPPNAGPCEPEATGGYLGPENQMIRVQVASVDPRSGVPTIVWGFDDATFLYELQSAVPGTSGLVLTLLQNPVDSYHYPQTGQAVELLRDAAALSPTDDGQGPFDYVASGSGFVTTVTSAYNPSLMNLTVADQPSADYLSTSATPQLYLRVWQGTVEAPPGTPVELKAAGATTGLQVTLSGNEGFHPGDFWCFAVRPGVPNLVYPARAAAFPQPPDGPNVWACPVAFVAWPDRGSPTITSCIPPFDNLVELTSNGGGCCTIRVTPGDLEGGASLSELMAGYRGSGPMKVCFAPGTYTLPAPIVLGPEYAGASLEACGPGVVLQAPARPGNEFLLGLIVVAGAKSVTVSGFDIRQPLVEFKPPPGAFDALSRMDGTNTNRTLVEEFTRLFAVSIGIFAINATDLTVEDCTFDVPSRGGGISIFSGSIVGTGRMTGLELSDCTFKGPAPNSVAFYDLAAGRVTASSNELMLGYVQVSAAAAERLSVLHDAHIEGCLFQGITVPALVMTRLGDIRIDKNIVRDCYGGFWLLSIAEFAYGLTFDVVPVGAADLRSNFENLGMTSLFDAAILLASAILRVLPDTPPTGDAVGSRIIQPADETTLVKLASGMKSFFGQAAGSLTAPPAASSPPSSPEISLQENVQALPAIDQLIQQIGAPAQQVPVATDTGVNITLRFDMSDCQVDAVLADSYSGAALIVADLTAVPGSAILHGNRLRNRFPDGQTALVIGLGDAALTGNVIANEVPGRERKAVGVGRSLVLWEGATSLSAPPVAIVGNVFIDPVVVPSRPGSLPAWQTLNTVIEYP